MPGVFVTATHPVSSGQKQPLAEPSQHVLALEELAVSSRSSVKSVNPAAGG
jgi:hypothetical protein